MLVSLLVLLGVYGVEYHQVILPTGRGGCISLHTGQGSRCGIHKELTFMLTASCMDLGYVTLSKVVVSHDCVAWKRGL